MAACGQSDGVSRCADQAGCNTPPANNAVNAAAPTNAAAAAPAPSPKLAQIFTADVLGSNVAFLETITGPAFRTDGSERTYKVGGCTVIVGATAGKIDNIGIDGYGPACSFPIAQYFAGGYDYAVPRVPTFGDIKKGLGGAYGATCLHLCGNAADPLVMLTYRGSHADNFNDLYATVTINQDGPAMNAFTDWGDKLGLAAATMCWNRAPRTWATTAPRTSRPKRLGGCGRR